MGSQRRFCRPKACSDGTNNMSVVLRSPKDTRTSAGFILETAISDKPSATRLGFPIPAHHRNQQKFPAHSITPPPPLQDGPIPQTCFSHCKMNVALYVT